MHYIALSNLLQNKIKYTAYEICLRKSLNHSVLMKLRMYLFLVFSCNQYFLLTQNELFSSNILSRLKKLKFILLILFWYNSKNLSQKYQKGGHYFMKFKAILGDYDWLEKKLFWEFIIRSYIPRNMVI